MWYQMEESLLSRFVGSSIAKKTILCVHSATLFLLNMALVRLGMLFRWQKNCVYCPIFYSAKVIKVLTSSPEGTMYHILHIVYQERYIMKMGNDRHPGQ